jgi:hypothetical protein
MSVTSEIGFLPINSRKILGFLSRKRGLYFFAETAAKYQVDRNVKNTSLLETSGSTQTTLGEDFGLNLRYFYEEPGLG